MKYLISILVLLASTSSFTQIHNRILKVNIGVSTEQFVVSRDMKVFNDTSAFDQFNHKFSSPTFSFSEEFSLNNYFSLAGCLGYQYFNIDYNNQKYGTNLFFGSINPQLTVYYKAGFEYYVKLKVGVIYRQGDLESIPVQTQRFFPSKINLFTGVTIAGINLFFHEKWGANFELSLWSPELVNVGLTYRFFKGEMPEDFRDDGYYTD